MRPEAEPSEPRHAAVAPPARLDAEALRALYDATAPRLLGVALRLLGDQAEAEDVVVETFALAARRPPDGDAFPWLCAVARGRAIARLRARATPPDLDREPDEVIPAAPSDAYRRLQTAMAELTPMQAASIRAAYLDGADYRALAVRAATPLGTLKSGLRRGLLRLKDAVEA